MVSCKLSERLSARAVSSLRSARFSDSARYTANKSETKATLAISGRMKRRLLRIFRLLIDPASGHRDIEPAFDSDCSPNIGVAVVQALRSDLYPFDAETYE